MATTLAEVEKKKVDSINTHLKQLRAKPSISEEDVRLALKDGGLRTLILFSRNKELVLLQEGVSPFSLLSIRPYDSGHILLGEKEFDTHDVNPAISEAYNQVVEPLLRALQNQNEFALVLLELFTQDSKKE